MSSHRLHNLLTEAKDVVALPSFPFELQHRGTQGLIWDLQHGELIEAALPALRSVPQCSDLLLDRIELEAQAVQAFGGTAVVEEAAIFGGYLIRHFGHFCHESLARLWWLGEGDPRNGSSREICSALQNRQLNVYFFMPSWLDSGKDLLPYMKEILAGLGLAEERIRIITEPLRFSRLIVPAQAWGFDLDARALDQWLGCDGKALMRSLFAGFNSSDFVGSPASSAAAAPERKVYVTRSGLPIHLGRPIGDSWLDEVLSDAGYLVFRPEQHTIQRQVETFSSARELVFIDGSSMYPLWFSRLQPGVRITIILRRRQGIWLGNKVRDLLPSSVPIRWRVIDAVVGQDLTSANDWESHNLLDLGAIARQLLTPHPWVAPARAELALARDLQDLATELDPEPMARILQVLFRRLVEEEPRPLRTLLIRLGQRLRKRLRFRS